MRTIPRTALLVTLALAGCASLGRESPPLQQYVLGNLPLAAAEAMPDAAGLTIGLRRLDLAPYLATPAIVVRRGTHEIVTSDFHRWGEDPGEGINRAVARYLAARPAINIVDVAPWPVRSQYDYLIQLHITSFEGVAPHEPAATEGEVHMAASWEIIRQLDGAVLSRGATDYRQRGWLVGDYAALVTLLDNGLDVLARDLAARLATLTVS